MAHTPIYQLLSLILVPIIAEVCDSQCFIKLSRHSSTLLAKCMQDVFSVKVTKIDTKYIYGANNWCLPIIGNLHYVHVLKYVSSFVEEFKWQTNFLDPAIGYKCWYVLT